LPVQKISTNSGGEDWMEFDWTQCVSLFYVIDTGSIGSRTRHHVTGWGLPIYPPPLAQTLAMPIYP